tara:strand:+ start:450 stop:704 length:255 start_codon:yes stop_codon:yes gene_type:complete
MSNGTVAKRITFRGNHLKLENGGQYTIKELSNLTGFSDSSLRSRIGRKTTCTECDFRVASRGKRSVVFEPPQSLSYLWLKKAIV